MCAMHILNVYYLHYIYIVCCMYASCMLVVCFKYIVMYATHTLYVCYMNIASML